MKWLFTMWLYPRLIVWFALATILGVLVRLPFAEFQIIPNYLDFHPGVVFVPLFGVFLGPAGVWGSVAASLIGDRLIGPWGVFSIFRALGFFVFSLSVLQMWNFSFRSSGRTVNPTYSWSHTARFILVAWPGCLLSASWQGLGSELLKLYPFSYVASLLALNNILFCTLLGLPFYRLMAALWVSRFGTWDDVFEAKAVSPSLRHVVFMAGGSVAALLSGFYMSEMVYHVSLLEPFAFGVSTGFLVPLTVGVMLLVNAVGCMEIK